MNVEEVWLEYRTGIRAFLHSKISDSDEVDDLLQEVLIKSFKNLSSVKSSKSVKAWLFKIANHTIIDFYRKRGRLQSISVDDLWYGENDQAVQQELTVCITPFIKALPKETSDMLMEIDLNRRSQKEYANDLGIVIPR